MKIFIVTEGFNDHTDNTWQQFLIAFNSFEKAKQYLQEYDADFEKLYESKNRNTWHYEEHGWMIIDRYTIIETTLE